MSEAVKQKVSMVSLGCPKNLVDAEVMLGYLDREGFSVTTDEHEAEIIIVNTCGFIKEAKQESIDTILDLADLDSVRAFAERVGGLDFRP